EKQVEKMKKMESGNLASGARTHAYAWRISPRPFPEFKVPRICVDISQLPTHMRDPLLPSKASIKVTPRICASSHAFAWPITFMCSSAFQEATKLTHMREHH
ncbi:hypothetical protein PIB30_100259, partial [Stylosanthes scabra]|nr:hypothetical protein [Stylosanthes scabra]